MAKVLPFRALRYASDRVALEKVLTQPYDKITSEMQERYYAADPHNLVRVILGKPHPDDSPRDNVYTRSARYLSEWRRAGVVKQDAQPGFYVYSQCFDDPSGRARERRGFIALCRLEDYSAGVVLRHEQTHSAPKADRLNLLRATRTHAESIFVLYDDTEGRTAALLLVESEPELDVNDEYGVRHRLWAIAEGRRIAELTSAMAEKKLVIADGHHRYETALTYRDECRAAAGQANPDAPYEYMLMTFVAMESDGLVILPTHRVLSGLPKVDEDLEKRLYRHFEIELFKPKPGKLREQLPVWLSHLESQLPRTAFIMWMRDWPPVLLRARTGRQAPPSQIGDAPASLDVVCLHDLIIKELLGISTHEIREQKYIAYVRDSWEVMERFQQGADVVFWMNPARIEQVRDVAFAGEVMPQKSTDFYPKLLSGLAMYALD